jgi:lysozyme family protein
MADFNKIIPWLLYQEDSRTTPGKIVNLGDGAGLTRLGITSKNFGEILPASFWTYQVNFADAIKTAKDFYQQQYWQHINGDRIAADAVAAVLLSFAVNKNIPVAVKTLQHVLGVLPDGVLGLVTVSTLNSKDPAALERMFRSEWTDFYHRLVNMNPSESRFLAGWLARAAFPFPSDLVSSIYG